MARTHLLAAIALLALTACTNPLEPETYGIDEAGAAARAKTRSPGPSLLGFRLGQPLSLPACTGKPHERREACMAAPDQVFIPNLERPVLVGQILTVRTDAAGRLQSVRATTSLPGTAIDELTAKYGDPEFSENPGIWTRHTWNFADMQVEVFIADSVEEDSITARTAAERQRVAVEQARVRTL